jgi:vacuolar-type H+-ATPase subunit H
MIMATKKKTKRATLQARVNELQKTAEKTLRKGVDRTFEILPPAPRKAVKGWVADLEKARVNLRKRTDKALREARKRVERVTSDVQKRVEKAVSPVTRNFEFASRKDIDSLRKRIDHIERRLAERAATVSHHEHSALA